jgi:hypothetical protein
MAMESGPDRICIRPSFSRLTIVSLVYTALALAVAFIVDQLILGGIVASIRVELAVLALCVWVPLQAGFSWYVCSFEIDAAGLHQNHLFAQLERVVRHLPGGNSISWEDRVWLMTHTRYIAAICCRVPKGGVLNWFRNLSRLAWIILPWKWLVADIDTLQSLVNQYAPEGHPLRAFYGVIGDVKPLE